MGAQVQGLLKALARAQDPHLPPDDELDTLAVAGDSIDAVISNELVLVASIPALQARNQQLLALVRKLGEEMESEEREYREAVVRENEGALQEAAEALTKLQDEVADARRAGDAQVKALLKERDTLKQLLERTKGSSSRLIEGEDGGELVKELQEVQAQFEAFREEADVDVAERGVDGGGVSEGGGAGGRGGGGGGGDVLHLACWALVEDVAFAGLLVSGRGEWSAA